MVQRKYAGSREKSLELAPYDSYQERRIHKRLVHLTHHPDVELPYVMHHGYRPDFFAGVTASGHALFIETKEWLTDGDCPKLEAVSLQHTTFYLIVVYQRAQPSAIRRLSKLDRVFVVHEAQLQQMLDQLTARRGDVDAANPR